MSISSDIRIHDYSEYNSTLFESKHEMNALFKESIDYLYEVNDNFDRNKS